MSFNTLPLPDFYFPDATKNVFTTDNINNNSQVIMVTANSEFLGRSAQGTFYSTSIPQYFRSISDTFKCYFVGNATTNKNLACIQHVCTKDYVYKGSNDALFPSGSDTITDNTFSFAAIHAGPQSQCAVMQWLGNPEYYVSWDNANLTTKMMKTTDAGFNPVLLYSIIGSRGWCGDLPDESAGPSTGGSKSSSSGNNPFGLWGIVGLSLGGGFLVLAAVIGSGLWFRKSRQLRQQLETERVETERFERYRSTPPALPSRPPRPPRPNFRYRDEGIEM